MSSRTSQDVKVVEKIYPGRTISCKTRKSSRESVELLKQENIESGRVIRKPLLSNPIKKEYRSALHTSPSEPDLGFRSVRRSTRNSSIPRSGLYMCLRFLCMCISMSQSPPNPSLPPPAPHNVSREKH